MTTRKLGFSALMTVVYSRLTTALPTYFFYNDVPKSKAMPYHVIGKPTGRKSEEFSNRDTQAEENVFQVDSWVDETSGKGDKSIADMMNSIMQALTSSSLTPTGYNTVMIFQIEYADVIKDEAEVARNIRHGIMRFRVHMSPP